MTTNYTPEQSAKNAHYDELDRFDLYPTEMLQEFLEQATLARDEIMDTISVIYAVLDERNVTREEKTWH